MKIYILKSNGVEIDRSKIDTIDPNFQMNFSKFPGQIDEGWKTQAQFDLENVEAAKHNRALSVKQNSRIVDGIEEFFCSANYLIEVEDTESIDYSMAHYVEFRTGPSGYASLGDQLDMQYKDLINGTTIWRDHVADVKARFPKPV